MKKRELIVGHKYARIDGKATVHGIPRCQCVTYLGDAMPDIKTKPGHCIGLSTAWDSEGGRVVQFKPVEIYATWKDYVDRKEKAEERALLRVELNTRAAAYLVEQLGTMYGLQSVWFDAESGFFRVSPKVMAELHGLPVPGTIEVPEEETNVA